VVAPDGRLRFERKFKVEIPTTESWDGRSVNARKGMQAGTPTAQCLPIRDGPGRKCTDKIQTKGKIKRIDADY